MAENTRGELMKQYNNRLASVQTGLSEQEVRAILGAPHVVTEPGSVTAPGTFFREIGSSFVFPDQNAEVIWAYVDPYRPRIRHYVGFQGGHVCAKWKETLTQERAEELG